MKLCANKLPLGVFGAGCNDRAHKPAGLRFFDAVGLGSLILAVVFVGRTWPAWVFMWALAVVLGGFCIWVTWRDARNVGLPTPIARTIGWFLLWPGMDGRAFFGSDRGADHRVCAPVAEWFAAFVKVALGCALIWIIAPHYFSGQPLAFGWCGMIGVILVLHFGIFHLLSLAWRACGVNAQPIMYYPLAATSLAQLWSERWNTAFSIPARRLMLLPLTRQTGLTGASLTVFAVSGLMHDLVISIPAGGGYGFPTAYFLLQGAGVWFERTKIGCALGLGSGVRGWLFTFTLAAGPVFWLFHPPFVRDVILPMLDAIGAH